jgi:hypothetical protein
MGLELILLMLSGCAAVVAFLLGLELRTGYTQWRARRARTRD